MLERSNLIKNISIGNDKDEDLPHVTFPLMGKFKGEDGERSHLLMSVATTASGLKVCTWTECLVKLLIFEGHMGVGPAICDSEGYLVSSRLMNEEFHTQLKRVQDGPTQLIPESIDVESFNINRSPRRGSNTRALEEGVREPDVDLINRWRTVERNKGQRPRSKMREYYLELRLIKKRYLRYSSKL